MARLLLIFLVPVLLIISIPLYLFVFKSTPPVPEMDLNAWWGPEQQKAKQDTSIKPYKVSFSPDVIKDLKDRIKRRRALTPPLEGIAFEYGFNTKELDNWLKYWSEEYPFAERETFLNQFPQFTTNIQGLNIHFIRVKPEVPAGVEVVPLLLLHGWPGSVREFYEAIPILTSVSKDRNFALEIIAPSLPGYGFSDPAIRPGLGVAEIAVIVRNLMQRLGYKQYYIQGGDWGSVICSALATLFPKEILGLHLNLAFTLNPAGTFLEFLGSFYPPLIMDSSIVHWKYPLLSKYADLVEESGYLHIQATKPDTVGVGLTDSPAGLLAYILEKFSTWARLEYRSKPDGGLSLKWTKDQLLDNIMIYWTTKSIVTSMRLYSENFNKRQLGYQLDLIPTPVPTWLLQAQYEISYQPPCVLKLKYPNLVNETLFHDGGHFLAFELPRPFSEDVLKAVDQFRKLNKNVKTEL
nr:juvenile hormone epoxide hydrolase-2 [Antheraea pernyi]